MIAHSKGCDLVLFEFPEKDNIRDLSNLEYSIFFDFRKHVQDAERNLRTYLIKVHYGKPNLVFVGTSQGMQHLNDSKAVMLTQKGFSFCLWTN